MMHAPLFVAFPCAAAVLKSAPFFSTPGPACRGARPVLAAWMAAVLAGLASGASRAAAAEPWPAMPSGSVVLIRHALAPGVGDPPGFRLGDCRTQRNLSDEGRADARRIGEQFRARGIAVAAVWASQWCRTKETAELAFPGRAQERPAFNSHFGRAEETGPQTERARREIGAWRGDGVLVVVTHQVNITALTGLSAASGDAVLLPGPRPLQAVPVPFTPR